MDDVESVAQAIAEAVGSRVFKPLHDTIEDQQIREAFRDLAEKAIALTLPCPDTSGPAQPV